MEVLDLTSDVDEGMDTDGNVTDLYEEVTEIIEVSRTRKMSKISVLAEYMSSSEGTYSSSEEDGDAKTTTQHTFTKPGISQTCFTVHLSKPLCETTPYRIVIFDLVDTNIGNTYSVTTGRFVCPIKGKYVFFITTTFTDKITANLCFIHNFHPVDPNKIEETTKKEHGFYSKTEGIVLTLDKNDEIWILNVTRVAMLKQLKKPDYTTFSGCLIEKLAYSLL